MPKNSGKILFLRSDLGWQLSSYIVLFIVVKNRISHTSSWPCWHLYCLVTMWIHHIKNRPEPSDPVKKYRSGKCLEFDGGTLVTVCLCLFQIRILCWVFNISPLGNGLTIAWTFQLYQGLKQEVPHSLYSVMRRQLDLVQKSLRRHTPRLSVCYHSGSALRYRSWHDSLRRVQRHSGGFSARIVQPCENALLPNNQDKLVRSETYCYPWWQAAFTDCLTLAEVTLVISMQPVIQLFHIQLSTRRDLHVKTQPSCQSLSETL